MTVDLLDAGVLFGVLAIACGVQTAFGFGLALLAVPLLSLHFSLALVTPLMALLSMTLGARIAWELRAAVRIDLCWRLLASAAAGIPVGIAVVVLLDEGTVRLALGTVVLVAGLRGLVAERSRPDESERAISDHEPSRHVSGVIWPVGFLTGVLGGAWNLMGPPLVLFLQWSRLAPREFRATLHAFAFVVNALVVAGWVSGSVVGPEAEPRSLALAYVCALMPLSMGAWAGRRVAASVDATHFRIGVHAFLVPSGVLLMVASLR